MVLMGFFVSVIFETVLSVTCSVTGEEVGIIVVAGTVLEDSHVSFFVE